MLWRIAQFAGCLSVLACAQTPAPRAVFRVKYLAAEAAYLDGGRSEGLEEGMTLTVERNGAVVAKLRISSVASVSAVCELVSSQGPLQVGDSARLSAEDAAAVSRARNFKGARHYAQVVSFTEGDPLEEEARALVPRPPLPEVNRARGRIGLEYGFISDRSGLSSRQTGLVFRGDLTRIAGTHWNLSGYWRGRFTSRSSGTQQDTLSDLLNRTYHLTLSYENPQSAYRAGFGRFYLPWAASLETIDGGYFARRLTNKLTAGVFGGSTPDPTSWNYAPGRQLFGAFLSYETGSFERWHYSGTGGYAMSRIRWAPERRFAFFENTLSYGQGFTVYHNLEADEVTRPIEAGGNVSGLARSFLTLRVQPARFLALDFNHNYFRDVPTFDPRLVGTGLLDRLLFEGVSAGARINLPRRMSVYASLGRSSRSGDEKRSLNQMYGFVMGNLFGSGIRADLRYSRFDSAFGRGVYRSISFSRDLGEGLRLDLQAGRQNLSSAFSRANRSNFVNGNLDWFVGAHYFLGAGVTVYRGPVQNYEQLFINTGYRF